MIKPNKLSLLIIILGNFLPIMICRAKYEQTTEIELIDMGQQGYSGGHIGRRSE